MENFKGFSLFTEVEDKELQAYNRGRVMMNMMEDHLGKDGSVSQKGAFLVLSYFERIPVAERIVAMEQAKQQMIAKGIRVE
ncbi:MAG: hypothetical protein [Podoviridae sp. ctbj_2]|nr:MAG: hypothetical protein [Podoviridae sp. ctbj_2]